MNPDENRPIENLLEGLSHHTRFLTTEEREAELRERGVDVDTFLKGAHSIIAHHQKDARLAWMKVADEKEKCINDSESGIESWLGKKDGLIKAAFEKLVRTTLPQHALAFRNKTDLTIDDMARILDDHERLKLRAAGPKPPPEKQ